MRPNGPPHDRHLEVTIDPTKWSVVVVVHEGPGLSGSTFLATAESTERCGFPRSRIVMIASHATERHDGGASDRSSHRLEHPRVKIRPRAHGDRTGALAPLAKCSPRRTAQGALRRAALSGVDARGRIDAWLIAYRAFAAAVAPFME